MSTEKFTIKFQEALGQAQSLAVGRMHSTIEPEHVLMAMLDQENSSIRALLKQAGADLLQLRSTLTQSLENCPKLNRATGEVHVSPTLARLLNLSDKLAKDRKDKFVSSELFLLAVMEEGGAAANALKSCGVNKAKLEEAINKIRGGESVQDENAEDTRQALEKYTIDLTERAEQGKLDPVIGRDEEIRRTIQVLQRRTKNNPVLIGEPGVGKTAIVEGLAQRIINQRPFGRVQALL